MNHCMKPFPIAVFDICSANDPDVGKWVENTFVFDLSRCTDEVLAKYGFKHREFFFKGFDSYGFKTTRTDTTLTVKHDMFQPNRPELAHILAGILKKEKKIKLDVADKGELDAHKTIDARVVDLENYNRILAFELNRIKLDNEDLNRQLENIRRALKNLGLKVD